MPLIEYIRTPVTLFEPIQGRNSFLLMEDHFDFVFKQCAYFVNPPIG